MLNQRKLYRRQWDLIRPSQLNFPITVVGVGGVGSWVTLALAKMGCQNITVVDNDVVEAKNIPSQVYTPNHIGEPKGGALKEVVEMFTAVKISIINKSFLEAYSNPLSMDVLIIAVDSLEQRRMIWSYVFPEGAEIPEHPRAYIDIRMGGDLMKIFTINPKQKNLAEKYGQRLFDSSIKPDPQPCTARSIVYNNLFCGAVVADIVKHYALKESVPPTFIFDLKTFRLI